MNLTEDEYLFDQVYKHLGGIFPINQNELFKVLFYRGREIILRKKLTQETLPLPIIDCINSSKFNASVTSNNGKFFIGINYGLIFTFLDIVGRMMSSNKIFPWIGDSSKEKDTNKIYKSRHTDFIQVYLSGGDKNNIPTDERRRLACTILLETVFKFLCCHEYVHIINGHWGYVSSQTMQAVYEENRKNEIPPIVSQVLEMDADMIAMNILLRDFEDFFLRDWDDFLKKNPIFKSEFKDFIDKEFRFKLFIIAILIFFTMMEPDEYSSLKQEDLTHPKSSLRSYYVTVNISSILHARNNTELIDFFEKNYTTLSDEVLMAFLEITESKDLFRLPIPSKEEMLYLEKLSWEWNNVRELIIPFATHSLIAPPFKGLDTFKNLPEIPYYKIQKK